MRCSFALIWDKKFNDKLGNTYHRIALEKSAEQFNDELVALVNKKLAFLPSPTRWELFKRLFNFTTPATLDKTDLAKDVAQALLEDFKNESNWVNGEHGEMN